jgi:transcription antitermination factor NusG
VQLEENIVTYLMQQANPQGVITARSDLKVGQEVRISGGPFEGLAGIIHEPPNARARVKVLVELLNRWIKIDVPLEFLESSRIAYQPILSIEHGSQVQG